MCRAWRRPRPVGRSGVVGGPFPIRRGWPAQETRRTAHRRIERAGADPANVRAWCTGGFGGGGTPRSLDARDPSRSQSCHPRPIGADAGWSLADTDLLAQVRGTRTQDTDLLGAGPWHEPGTRACLRMPVAREPRGRASPDGSAPGSHDVRTVYLWARGPVCARAGGRCGRGVVVVGDARRCCAGGWAFGRLFSRARNVVRGWGARCAHKSGCAREDRRSEI